MAYFNSQFDICSLIFLLLLIYYFVTKHKNYSVTDKIFVAFLFTLFLLLISDILLAFCMANVAIVSSSFLYGISIFQLEISIIIPSIFCLYGISSLNPQKNQIGGLFNLYLIPTMFCLSILIMNPITNKMFYFDEYGRYILGDWHWISYINGLFYLIICYIYILSEKRTGTVHYKTVYMSTLRAIIIIMLIVMGIQIKYPYILIIGTGLTLSTFIVYLTFQYQDVYSDLLMGISNRTAMVNMFEYYLNSNKEFKIILIALDSFKLINSVFGIQNGDLILKVIAEKVCKKIKNKNDVYRYSGDILAIVLDSNNETDKLISEIREIFNKPCIIDKLEIQISACICLIYSTNHENNIKNLISTIDYSVVEAKKMGHNSLYVENEGLLNDMNRKIAIEKLLTENVNSGKIELFFQPIYSVKSDSFVSAEVLARLDVPGYGYIAPEEFISIAESSGQISEIGLIIISETCRIIKENELCKHGLEFVEINLSMAQCMQDRLASQITSIIDSYEIPRHNINFEITETVAAYSNKMLIYNMNKLNSEGLSFILDDYGTGYSTISYISRLPFKIVKLDKEIVQTSLDDIKGSIILASTVDMLRNLNLLIVAEGVEYLEQAQRLKDMKVDYMQGYYYAKPMPEKKFIEFLLMQENKKNNEKDT